MTSKLEESIQRGTLIQIYKIKRILQSFLQAKTIIQLLFDKFSTLPIVWLD